MIHRVVFQKVGEHDDRIGLHRDLFVRGGVFSRVPMDSVGCTEREKQFGNIIDLIASDD
jgi:transcriptional regulator of nitric oxide reductase